MNKIFLSIFFLFIVDYTLFGQIDTLIVTDFSKEMWTLDRSGKALPVFDIEKEKSVGLFLTKAPLGTFRICNEGPVSIWVDGKFFKEIDGCHYLSGEEISINYTRDTLFVSCFALDKFSKFSFDEIEFQKTAVTNKITERPRAEPQGFNDFIVIVFLTLTLITALFRRRYPLRFDHIFKGVFTFKRSIYDVINTQFLGGASLFSVLLLSLQGGFVWIYAMNQTDVPNQLATTNSNIFYVWLWNSAIIFFLVVVKWLMLGLFAKLFGFRKNHDFQLFDFMNFLTFFFSLIVAVLMVGFIIDISISMWVVNFKILFSGLLAAFVLWYGTKLVSTIPHQKLLIISYLCATEIIPTIFLMGWFFK